MNGVVIPLALTVVTAAGAIWAWRRRRRVTGFLVGVVSVGAALVAIRDLPGPVVVGLLLATLGMVAAITAWPLFTRGRRAGSAKGDPR